MDTNAAPSSQDFKENTGLFLEGKRSAELEDASSRKARQNSSNSRSLYSSPLRSASNNVPPKLSVSSISAAIDSNTKAKHGILVKKLSLNEPGEKIGRSLRRDFGETCYGESEMPAMSKGNIVRSFESAVTYPCRDPGKISHGEPFKQLTISPRKMSSTEFASRSVELPTVSVKKEIGNVTKGVLKNRKWSTPDRLHNEPFDNPRSDQQSLLTISGSLPPCQMIKRKVPCIALETEKLSLPLKKDISFSLPEDDFATYQQNIENQHNVSVPSGSVSAPCDTSTNVDVQFQPMKYYALEPSNAPSNLQRKRKMPVRLTIPVPQLDQETGKIIQLGSERHASQNSGVFYGVEEMKSASPSVVTFSQKPAIISNYSANGK